MMRLTRIEDKGDHVKRRQEFRRGFMPLMKTALSDKTRQMIMVTGLATAPEKRGRGYATALMARVHEKVSPASAW